MRDVYVRAKKEANYTATYFLTMLSELRRASGLRIGFLRDPKFRAGSRPCYERGRLDLTMEALVVKPEFASLFTEDEIEIGPAAPGPARWYRPPVAGESVTWYRAARSA